MGAALLFLLLGVGLLVAYRATVGVRVGDRQAAVEQHQGELDGLHTERTRLEAALARARKTAGDIGDLEKVRLGTQSTRLTATMARVKQLARDAGLDGVDAISYVDHPVEGFDLLQKSIVFSAQGSYAELRRFINLLELSDSFLTLDKIRVSGDDGDHQLRLELQLSTLFEQPQQQPERGST